MDLMDRMADTVVTLATAVSGAEAVLAVGWVESENE